MTFFLPVAASTALAQDLSDGSVYSRFGVGERKLFHSSFSQATGGGGLALGSARYINFANPASFSSQTLTRFSGGYTHETVTAEAEGAERGRLSSGSLNALSFGFPLYTGRTGVAVSFAPFTRVAYRVDVPGSLPDPDGGEDTPFTTSFNGNGGLQKLSAGLGQRVSNSVSVGATVDYVFGILEETEHTLFNSPSYVDLAVVQGTRMRGLTATLGLRYSRPRLVGEDKGIRIGAVFTLPTRLSANRAFTLDSSADSDTLRAGVDGDVTIPLAAGLGISYLPDDRWTLMADIQFENWSTFESDLSFPAASGSHLTNRFRLSGGFEFMPSAGSSFGGFFDRIAYRMGVYKDVSYVTPVSGQDIDIYGLTGGLSLPSLVPGTTIDINMDVGRRGSLENGLIRDTYLRLGVNVNFGERWFTRLPLG